MVIRCTFLLFLFSLVSLCDAQDLHQTDYRYNPLYLNPAKTGSFYGSIRAGLVYRDQFRSFIDKPYQSPFLFVDSPIAFGLNEQHWIGVGGLLYADRAGDVGFTTNGLYGSVAYHMGFDKKFNQVFTIGVQYGFVSKSVNDAQEARFADGLVSGAPSLDQSLVQGNSTSYTDLNVGIMYTNRISKYSTWQFGGSFLHALSPKYRFDNGSADIEVDGRFNIHGSWKYDYTKRLTIEPTVYFYSVPSSSVLSAQFNVAYKMAPEKEMLLKGGLGYRTNDAIELLFGVFINGWDIGLAYDFTVSSAAGATNRFGGIELGINRIFRIYKKPEVKPVKLCPRY